MSRKSLTETMQRVLTRAGVVATVRIERITQIDTHGPRTAGYRLIAKLPELTAQQRRAVHVAAMDSAGVRYHADPSLSHPHLSLEGV